MMCLRLPSCGPIPPRNRPPHPGDCREDGPRRPWTSLSGPTVAETPSRPPTPARSFGRSARERRPDPDDERGRPTRPRSPFETDRSPHRRRTGGRDRAASAAGARRRCLSRVFVSSVVPSKQCCCAQDALLKADTIHSKSMFWFDGQRTSGCLGIRYQVALLNYDVMYSCAVLTHRLIYN